MPEFQQEMCIKIRPRARAGRSSTSCRRESPLKRTDAGSLGAFTAEKTDHHFVRRADGIHRCNKLWLDKTVDGATTRSLLYENDCRVMYPADHLVRSDQSEPS